MAALGGEGARIDCCSRPWLGEISTAGSSAGACGGVVGAPAHWWGERLPASSQNHKRPDVGGMGPASERMVAATGDKKYAGVLVVKGGGRLVLSPGNGQGRAGLVGGVLRSQARAQVTAGPSKGPQYGRGSTRPELVAV